MMALNVLAASFLTACAAGVIASATLPDRRVPAVLACTGSAMAMMLMAIGLTVLATGHLWSATLWTVAPFGALTLEVDRLAAVFITAMGLVCLPVSLFSAGYLLRYLGRYSLRSFGILYHGLLAAIALTLATSDVLAFLLAWEAMAILSYFLVNYEHEQREHTHAGYLMLVMGEAGTVAVMVAFLLLINAAGGLPFAALRHAAATAGVQTRWAVFLLSFFGFGVRAGLLPGSSWLPRAHPAAPANVSAVLSGVILNLGLYGIIRVNLDLLPAHLVGPGIVVLVVGSLSALVGILYATTQNDLKAMLAHSSIENIGIVTAALGAGLVFGASGEATLASMAYVAALYHMVNHSAYKGLLFLGAGAVDGGAGERHMDRLGGLIRRMPWTAMFFLVGALAIAAMPPFNGFASEWLTLQTLLRSVELHATAVKIVFALCGAALALTASLAATCFVKTFAMSFLGLPRSGAAGSAHEAAPTALAAMGILAAVCLALGILPTYTIPALSGAVAPLTHASAADALVPSFFAPATPGHALPASFVADFRTLGAQVGRHLLPGRGLIVLLRGGTDNPVVFAMSTSYAFPVLLGLIGLVYLAVHVGTRARTLARRPRWDGGVPRLDPEMTYTATGFSNPVRVVFNAVFHPSMADDTTEVVAEHFRTAVRRARVETYVADRFVADPLAGWSHGLARALAAMHRGGLNTYAAYVLLTLLLVLVAARLL